MYYQLLGDLPDCGDCFIVVDILEYICKAGVDNAALDKKQFNKCWSSYQACGFAFSLHGIQERELLSFDDSSVMILDEHLESCVMCM